MNLPEATPLVNSVLSAELPRIEEFFDNTENKKGVLVPSSGFVIICKVFLNKCVSDVNHPFFK